MAAPVQWPQDDLPSLGVVVARFHRGRSGVPGSPRVRQCGGRPILLTLGSCWAAAGGRGCPLPTLNHCSDFSEQS